MNSSNSTGDSIEDQQGPMVHIPEFVTDNTIIEEIVYIRDFVVRVQDFLKKIKDNKEVAHPGIRDLIKRKVERLNQLMDGIIWRNHENNILSFNKDEFITVLDELDRFIMDFGEIFT